MTPSLGVIDDVGAVASPLVCSLERRSSPRDNGTTAVRGRAAPSRGGDEGRFCAEAPGDGTVAVLLELSPLRNGLLKLPRVRLSGDEGLPEDCGLG